MSSFVKQADVRQENFDWGVIGWRLVPDSGSKQLVIMDVTLEPSGGHDFHRHPGQLFDHVFADQRRVPARAAGGDDDLVDVHEVLVAHVEPTQLRGPVVQDQAAAHGVLHRLRLLEYLLDHEVVVTAALDGGEVPLDALDRPPEQIGRAHV